MTKYKTIEDFKNQIPEGATHYTNECNNHYFAFFKLVDGDVYTIEPEYYEEWNNSKYTKLHDIKNLIALNQSNKESDYDKGMREAMKKIAVSCGKQFSFDIGYESLPDLVESLVNPKPEPKEPKFKYVKVEDSIFDLKAEFEAGELFFSVGDRYYEVIVNEGGLAECFSIGDVYRRVERKEEDELFEVLSLLHEEWEEETDDCSSNSLVTYITKSGKLKLA